MVLSLSTWIDAARPRTLGAAVAPVVVGSILGWRLGGQPFSWPLLAFTLGSCIALQIATNWFNDALDFMKGSDTAHRVGPRRITAAGLVPARQVMLAGWLMLGLATLLAAPLILARGWPIIAIGIPSLYFSYGYTGGPMPLAYRGLGELFVILFFGLIAVAGSAFVQSGMWHPEAVMAGLQMGCLSTVLLAVNNFRDVVEDRGSGKRTLAVRYGERFARIEIALLILAPHVIGMFWWGQGLRLGWMAPLMVLPMGLYVIHRIRISEPGAGCNRLLALSGAQLLLFSALFGWAMVRGT